MRIQIARYEFDLSEPFRSGHVLTTEEAKALNVVRSERIRNKVARVIERATPDGELLTGERLASLRAQVARIDSNFEFNIRNTDRAKRGTIEGEVRVVAMERAEAAARENGRENDLGLVEQLALSFLDDPTTEAEAARRLETRRAVAASSLSEL